ncbi:MAG: peptidylprolyl isomerase [Pseudomonadales bacterium]|nr:peptidylprolyl isomerase [Pseudomonadales bacterium]
MDIAEGSVVTIHYTLTDAGGQVIDTSEGGDPLTYLHGYGGLIPGLERELEEKSSGDKLEVSIAPEDGYGLADPELIQEVPLAELGQIENLAVGMRLQSKDQEGRVHSLKVDAISESSATLNANHELAGQTLFFAVSIESVRTASEEELSHGHAH